MSLVPSTTFTSLQSALPFNQLKNDYNPNNDFGLAITDTLNSTTLLSRLRFKNQVLIHVIFPHTCQICARVDPSLSCYQSSRVSRFTLIYKTTSRYFDTKCGYTFHQENLIHHDHICKFKSRNDIWLFLIGSVFPKLLSTHFSPRLVPW